jgi:hypothetical protein
MTTSTNRYFKITFYYPGIPTEVKEVGGRETNNSKTNWRIGVSEEGSGRKVWLHQGSLLKPACFQMIIHPLYLLLRMIAALDENHVIHLLFRQSDRSRNIMETKIFRSMILLQILMHFCMALLIFLSLFCALIQVYIWVLLNFKYHIFWVYLTLCITFSEFT